MKSAHTKKIDDLFRKIVFTLIFGSSGSVTLFPNQQSNGRWLNFKKHAKVKLVPENNTKMNYFHSS